ncbi:MAG: hypothetical protein QOD55_1225 [Solirubrobacteraceae bacterium]|jgi:hypothetical protein|nr:hypothetical protein [Solirubrobacteraceae bacterium]
MSVTDEVSAVVEEHGAAVHAAARALVTSGADALTLDVFRAVVAALEAGDERPTVAVVRDAFVSASEAVRPPLPGARRLQAMRLLDQTGDRPPAWLLADLSGLGPIEHPPAEPAEPAAEPRPAVAVDPAWLPDELAAAEAAQPPAGPAPAWAPDAEAPAAATELAPRRRHRRFRPGPLAAAAALLLLLAAGAYLLTRDDGTPVAVPGPAAAQRTAPESRKPAKTAAERRAERRRARAARRDARAQRRDAVKAHKRDAVSSFVAFSRRTAATRQTAAPAAAAPPATSAPSAPATSRPAPAPTSAPPPKATSAPPSPPPPSKDPPGRHAP